MKSGQENLKFNPISEEYRKILPMFGAHPLSNIFNEAPILLLEGEDDERIWQQVVRSSVGRIRLFPCFAGSKTQMNNYETHTEEIINAVYENAKAFSLRDRDEGDEEIKDQGHVIRMKLSCRCAENLILTNEVLESQGVNWDKLKQKIKDWLDKNTDHNHYKILEKFKNDGWLRKDGDIKNARNDIVGIIGTNKPWEVIVGQAIAKLEYSSDIDFSKEGSLFSFLGEKVTRTLLIF